MRRAACAAGWRAAGRTLAPRSSHRTRPLTDKQSLRGGWQQGREADIQRRNEEIHSGQLRLSRRQTALALGILAGVTCTYYVAVTNMRLHGAVVRDPSQGRISQCRDELGLGAASEHEHALVLTCQLVPSHPMTREEVAYSFLTSLTQSPKRALWSRWLDAAGPEWHAEPLDVFSAVLRHKGGRQCLIASVESGTASDNHSGLPLASTVRQGLRGASQEGKHAFILSLSYVNAQDKVAWPVEWLRTTSLRYQLRRAYEDTCHALGQPLKRSVGAVVRELQQQGDASDLPQPEEKRPRRGEQAQEAPQEALLLPQDGAQAHAAGSSQRFSLGASLPRQ